MTKVSVLVAVYNAEEYLCKCIDSLLCQTLQDIQIICIDDASTDSSLSILRAYERKDSRVVVISLSENRGQAVARNEGLKVAEGEYTCFLDSDDWLSQDALQQAVDVFEKYPLTDSVLFQVQMVTSRGNHLYQMPSFSVMTGHEAFEASLTWKIHGVYMVRTSLHQQIPYDTTCRSYSDDNTTRLHYLKSREVRLCDGIYYYRQHATSTTHQISIRRFDYLRAGESMKKQMEELAVSERLLNIYENARWLVLIDTYMFYYKYRRQLGREGASYGLKEMKRIWSQIDIKRLVCRNRYKFGYMPLRFSWSLFRLQEEVYFSLRCLLKSL